MRAIGSITSFRILGGFIVASLAASLAACGGQDAGAGGSHVPPRAVTATVARLPRAPGEYAPSLVAIDRQSPSEGGGDPDGFAGGAGVLPREIDPHRLDRLLDLARERFDLALTRVLR